MCKSLVSLLFFFCCLVLGSSPLFSQDTTIYKINWNKDAYVFALDGVLLGSAYLIDHNQDIISATELDLLNADDINSFDKSAISRYNLNSAKNSDYCRDMAFILPLAFLAGKQGRKEWKNISILYLETLLTNTALTSITKVTASRKRPFTYNKELSIAQRQTSSAERSFYSGHVSHVSSLSFFTASILTDLYPKSKLKYLWWTAATTLPAVTAYLRYDAGRHFPSDVIVGYFLGGAVGYLVPKLHKVNNDKYNISIIPSTNSLSFSLGINLN